MRKGQRWQERSRCRLSAVQPLNCCDLPDSHQAHRPRMSHLRERLTRYFGIPGCATDGAAATGEENAAYGSAAGAAGCEGEP